VLEVALGCIVVAVIVIWGYRRRYLTGPGAIAACVVGGCIWASGEWGLVVPLVFFFTASSVLTRWAAVRVGKISPTADQKTTRDAWQVGANGLVTAGCALAALASGEVRWLYGGLAALAAMTGDTWSAEIGRVAARRPLDLRSFRRVEAGISGAVSLIGTLAGLAGAVLTTIIGVALLPGLDRAAVNVLLLVGGWATLAGWVDSLLGATIQMRFRCTQCGKLTDHRIHCGQPAQRTAGIPGIDNSTVNLLATVFAALVVFLL
jgi:uncharacterized protein (TIGR00297 family)